MNPPEHAWRPLWVSPPAMLAAEMLAEAAAVPVDELVDVVLLELLDQQYLERRRRASQALHSPPDLQPKRAQVISLSQARHRRAAGSAAAKAPVPRLRAR